MLAPPVSDFRWCLCFCILEQPWFKNKQQSLPNMSPTTCHKIYIYVDIYIHIPVHEKTCIQNIFIYSIHIWHIHYIVSAIEICINILNVYTPLITKEYKRHIQHSTTKQRSSSEPSYVETRLQTSAQIGVAGSWPNCPHIYTIYIM